MNYPLSTNEDGINIKPELMEQEKLYHCIFKEKVLLLFKDSQNFLNCYEIEEKHLLEQIKACKNDSEQLEKILENYIKLE